MFKKNMGTASEQPMRFFEGQNPAVMAAKRKFLPDEVPLSEWIDRRIGGEAPATVPNVPNVSEMAVEFVSIWQTYQNCLVVWNMNFMTFHILGIIIPTDELIFFRGVETTNQKNYGKSP
jgi:hypothetical protein